MNYVIGYRAVWGGNNYWNGDKVADTWYCTTRNIQKAKRLTYNQCTKHNGSWTIYLNVTHQPPVRNISTLISRRTVKKYYKS